MARESAQEAPRPARWTSRYASLATYPRNAEFRQTDARPIGGINERGLVVQGLHLSVSSLPEPEGRESVDSLEWIQFALDRFAGVEELLAALRSGEVPEIVTPRSGKLHYLACSPGQGCAAIELLAGALVARRVPSPAALANIPWEDGPSREESIRRGGAEPLRIPPESYRSFDRLVAVHASVAASSGPGDLQDEAPVARAFRILDQVRFRPELMESVIQGSSAREQVRFRRLQGRYDTHWQVVFDPNDPGVAWRTARRPEIRFASLGALAADPDAAPARIDLDEVGATDAALACRSGLRSRAAAVPVSGSVKEKEPGEAAAPPRPTEAP